MSDSLLPVLPSLAIAPSMRQTMIEVYGQLADTWRDIGRPADEADCRTKAAALQYGGTVDFAVLLEEP